MSIELKRKKERKEYRRYTQWMFSLFLNRLKWLKWFCCCCCFFIFFFLLLLLLLQPSFISIYCNDFEPCLWLWCLNLTSRLHNLCDLTWYELLTARRQKNMDTFWFLWWTISNCIGKNICNTIVILNIIWYLSNRSAILWRMQEDYAKTKYHIINIHP